MQTVCDNMEINCSQKFTLTIHIQSPGRVVLETEITPQILMLLLQDSDLTAKLCGAQQLSFYNQLSRVRCCRQTLIVAQSWIMIIF